MGNRVFICTHSQLPRGDANSNYIFHMALALVQAGHEVIAIGRSTNSEKKVIDVDGVHCINLRKLSNIPAKLEGHLMYGKRLVKELQSLKISKNDYVIIYGGYISLFTVLKRNLKFMEQGHLIPCVVEWPTHFQYRYGAMDPDYRLWRYVFYHMIPHWKKVIVISSNLKRHFNKMGCQTFLMPPLIDSKKRASGNKKRSEVTQFIYAGADIQKDAIDNMILSLSELSEEERIRFNFNITSLTLEKAEKLLGERKEVLKEFSKTLKIHGWMEYDDLINLYYASDFLLLAREKNQFTQSNFPSKVPEMMNYGIIPVCSRVGDYTELYLHDMKDSVIFEGASPKDCADAIRRALNISDEKRRQMSFNAVETAKTNFDYRIWGDHLSKFLIG